MSLRGLLDVNVLVALFDPEHVHHEPAHGWLAANRSEGWATCPLTENAVVRVLANASYSGVSERPARVAEWLGTFRASGDHEFWPADVSLLDRRLFRLELVEGHRQLTDLYLLGLAVRHGGRLVTFDRRIPVKGVAGARDEHRLVIPA